MLSTVFVITYGSLLAVVNLLLLAGRIAVKQHAATMVILNVVSGVVSAVNGWTEDLYISTACTALFAYVWWHNGGGDGTRRRLKSWARRFQGVRRTAPSHA